MSMPVITELRLILLELKRIREVLERDTQTTNRVRKDPHNGDAKVPNRRKTTKSKQRK